MNKTQKILEELTNNKPVKLIVTDTEINLHFYNVNQQNNPAVIDLLDELIAVEKEKEVKVFFSNGRFGELCYNLLEVIKNNKKDRNIYIDLEDLYDR